LACTIASFDISLHNNDNEIFFFFEIKFVEMLSFMRAWRYFIPLLGVSAYLKKNIKGVVFLVNVFIGVLAVNSSSVDIPRFALVFLDVKAFAINIFVILRERPLLRLLTHLRTAADMFDAKDKTISD
jgi:hypothetical protein